MFERTSTPKMSKSKVQHSPLLPLIGSIKAGNSTAFLIWICLQEAQSPEGGIIVNAAKGGCAEGLVYSGGGKEGIFIKTIVPESPASKSLEVKEGYYYNIFSFYDID